MNKQPVCAIIFLGIFLLLIGLTHALYRLFDVSSEYSRKFLHVTGGLLALTAPLFFTSHWWVFILCSLAFLLLLFTYLKHWLPSIHHIERKSIGSVVYPIPIYLCFLVASNKNNDLLFYLPISFLTICDTLAEVGGKKWGNKSRSLMYQQKTVAGSLSFAVSALAISIAWGTISNLTFLQFIFICTATALVSTATEMISTKGWDNITVPLVALACLLLLFDN